MRQGRERPGGCGFAGDDNAPAAVRLQVAGDGGNPAVVLCRVRASTATPQLPGERIRDVLRLPPAETGSRWSAMAPVIVGVGSTT